MVSFFELWSRSLDLWLINVHKGILYDTNEGLLRLFVSLCNPKCYAAFSQALIHCRGDVEDPLMQLLLKLSVLSRYYEDAPINANINRRSDPGNKYSEPDIHENPDASTTAAVISRSILAAVTPLLLHVFLSRRKRKLRVQERCHCYSAILKDVDDALKGSGNLLNGSPLYCKAQRWQTYKRGTSLSPKGLRKGFGKTSSKCPIYRDPKDLAILRCSSVQYLLSQVDPKDDRDTRKLVESIKRSEESNETPPDNISGIETLLMSLCDTYKFKEFGDIPYSLFQLYEELPEKHKVIKSRVEKAIIYIERLHSLDLEFKFSDSHMLKEASKANTLLRQHLRSRKWGTSQPYGTAITPENGTTQRQKQHEESNQYPSHNLPAGTRGPLQSWTSYDSNVSYIVGKCLLFCGDNVSGFMKLCSAIRESGLNTNKVTNTRLLLLASAAMLRCTSQGDYTVKEPLYPSSSMMAYYQFVTVVDAICSPEFIDIKPSAMVISQETSIDWIAGEARFTLSSEGTSNGRNTAGTEQGSIQVPLGNTTNGPADENSDIPILSNTAKTITDQDISLVVNRDAFVKSMSYKVGKKVQISEEGALCILKAHATFFKLHFNHLRTTFLEMDRHFILLHSESKAEGCPSGFHTIIREICQGKRRLAPEDKRGPFHKLCVPYSFVAYTKMVFNNFTARMTSDMFVRALWLSNNHMHRLCNPIRQGTADIYL